ncbi:class I SAM-dependent methyltransferase [Deinococcus cavernae]|uniref:Class I SAM-dependent methyltransferase n=1 Tax=Deinococcus cavernae TaxID=2320857 RepID=A0A418V6W1_9DEIO|nr:class I SAM-dependent methyltransferase [Deinococcus cavernae]RJF71800.1 class I SAM-dependent methyltransferase [Deinococcus cavernae]
MPQNIYDQLAFFEEYSRMRRSVQGLSGAPEWLAMRALLPDLTGLRVLDLGCGFGWFCRWSREHGARAVTGVDISVNMLERARTSTSDAEITYLQADLEDLHLPAESFEVVYSSLALHYVAALPGLLRQVHAALSPGGRFLFSVEHPIFTAARHTDWLPDGQGGVTWPVDGYRREGPRTRSWLSQDVVKQHRTIGTYLNSLIQTGFVLQHVEEWGPTDQQVLERPELAVERERPMFLLVAAQKRT